MTPATREKITGIVTATVISSVTTLFLWPSFQALGVAFSEWLQEHLSKQALVTIGATMLLLIVALSTWIYWVWRKIRRVARLFSRYKPDGESPDFRRRKDGKGGCVCPRCLAEGRITPAYPELYSVGAEVGCYASGCDYRGRRGKR